MTNRRSVFGPRFLRVAMLVFAFIAPPTIAGLVTLYFRMHNVEALDPAARGDVPPPAPHPPTTTMRLAVIVAGNRGTEITDSLPLNLAGRVPVRVTIVLHALLLGMGGVGALLLWRQMRRSQSLARPARRASPAGVMPRRALRLPG